MPEMPGASKLDSALPAPHEENSWRIFVAVAFPDELKERCRELVERLKMGIQFTGAHPAWVKSQSLHLTLAFLGRTPLTALPNVQKIIQSTADSQKSISLSLRGVGLFPTPKNPRVISLHLHGDLVRLERLQDDLTKQLRASGFPVDDRPFRPHVTLARLKSMRGLAGVRDIVQSHGDSRVGDVRVDRLTLYRSHLLPDGAEYEVVYEAPFGRLD